MFNKGAGRAANSKPKPKPKSWLASWLEARLTRKLEPKDTHLIRSKRIYIFLTKEGFLFALTLFCLFLAGVNYANNLVLGLCFFLASVFVVSFHMTHAQLMNLQLRVVEGGGAEAGSALKVKLECAETHGRSRQLELEFVGQSTTLLTLTKGRALCQLDCVSEKTGVQNLPPLKVVSRYPFGLTFAWSYMQFEQPVFFWPKAHPTNTPPLKPTTNSSAAKTKAQGGSEDFEGLKSFEPAESVRRISWKHYARGQGLLSLKFEEPQHSGFFLSDLHTSEFQLDSKFGELVFWAQQFDAANKPFGLDLGATKVPVGRGAEHLNTVLKTLAEVHSSYHMGDA